MLIVAERIYSGRENGLTGIWTGSDPHTAVKCNLTLEQERSRVEGNALCGEGAFTDIFSVSGYMAGASFVARFGPGNGGLVGSKMGPSLIAQLNLPDVDERSDIVFSRAEHNYAAPFTAGDPSIKNRWGLDRQRRHSLRAFTLILGATLLLVVVATLPISRRGRRETLFALAVDKGKGGFAVLRGWSKSIRRGLGAATVTTRASLPALCLGGFVLLVVLDGIYARAENDLTGVWRGSIQNTTVCELTLTQDKARVEGTALCGEGALTDSFAISGIVSGISFRGQLGDYSVSGSKAGPSFILRYAEDSVSEGIVFARGEYHGAGPHTDGNPFIKNRWGLDKRGRGLLRAFALILGSALALVFVATLRVGRRGQRKTIVALIADTHQRALHRERSHWESIVGTSPSAGKKSPPPERTQIKSTAWERIKASAPGRWEVEGEIFEVSIGTVDGEEGLVAKSVEDGREVISGWVLAAGRKLSEPLLATTNLTASPPEVTQDRRMPMEEIQAGDEVASHRPARIRGDGRVE